MRLTKLTVALLLAALLLTACGGAVAPEQPAEQVDLDALCQKIEKVYPDMMAFEGDMRFNFLGIREEDCAQCCTLLCDDGMKADELWLLEAADDEAMERLVELAEQRMEAKAQETKDYNPAQYEIVMQGQILTSGRYLALIVTPEVEKAVRLFQEAVG